MSRSYWQVGEVTRHLEAIADDVDSHRRADHPIYLPPELVSAARRIAEAADWGRTRVIGDQTSISRAVLQVIEVSEVVTASMIRTRLAAAGRMTSIATITVALHRACGRGHLVSPARGQFRLPTAEEKRIVAASKELDKD